MSTLKEQMESLTRGIESSTRERRATVVNCQTAAHKMLSTFRKERALGTKALTTALSQGRSKLKSEDVAMRHDLHHAAVNRRRWTKNIATTVASMLTTFTKQRDEQTKSQHVALVKSRSKLSTDVASLMKSITVSHRAMAQSLSDSLHAYMKVARSHGAALHGSFMAPAMLKPAMAAGGHMHVEAASTHSPLIIHDQGHDSGDRQRGKRKT